MVHLASGIVLLKHLISAHTYLWFVIIHLHVNQLLLGFLKEMFKKLLLYQSMLWYSIPHFFKTYLNFHVKHICSTESCLRVSAAPLMPCQHFCMCACDECTWDQMVLLWIEPELCVFQVEFLKQRGTWCEGQGEGTASGPLLSSSLQLPPKTLFWL